MVFGAGDLGGFVWGADWVCEFGCALVGGDETPVARHPMARRRPGGRRSPPGDARHLGRADTAELVVSLAQVAVFLGARRTAPPPESCACFPTPLAGLTPQGVLPRVPLRSPWATILRRFAAYTALKIGGDRRCLAAWLAGLILLRARFAVLRRRLGSLSRWRSLARSRLGRMAR